MLDPIANAIEVWLSFTAFLPLPIIALLNLSYAIFAVLILFHLIYKIRS